jgi:hypothetical protein
MQRAAASSPAQSAVSPSRTPASEPPSKRRRVDNESHPSTPRSQPDDSASLKSSHDVQAQARSRYSKEGDETEWVLNAPLPRTEKQSPSKVNGSQHTPQGHTEGEDEDDIWAVPSLGRQTFGTFKRKMAQRTAETPKQNGDGLSSASDSDEPPSPRPSYNSHHGGDRRFTGHGSTKSTQAPKRFFDKISLSTSPTKPGKPAKERNKKSHNHKKSRMTI